MLKKRSFQVLLFFCFLFALHPSGKKEVSDIEQNGKSEKLYILFRCRRAEIWVLFLT